MWIKRAEAKRVIIIDDVSASDDFMTQIFQLAAPPGVTVDVYSTLEAGERWKENSFGEPGPILCLFRSVPQMFDAYRAGFHFSSVQLGGIGGGPGRINVAGPIALDETDAKMLQSLHEEGITIVFQVTPEMRETDWPSVKAKYFSK